jgi:hypothetical protein
VSREAIRRRLARLERGTGLPKARQALEAELARLRAQMPDYTPEQIDAMSDEQLDDFLNSMCADQPDPIFERVREIDEKLRGFETAEERAKHERREAYLDTLTIDQLEDYFADPAAFEARMPNG